MTAVVKNIRIKDGKMESTRVPEPAPVQDAVGKAKAVLPIRNTTSDLI